MLSDFRRYAVPCVGDRDAHSFRASTPSAGAPSSYSQASSKAHGVYSVADQVVQDLAHVSFITSDRCRIPMLHSQLNLRIRNSALIETQRGLQELFDGKLSRFRRLSMKTQCLSDDL